MATTPKKSFAYRVVDVFTQQPLEGNPLAVFPEAAGLDDATMQQIARELNLSETVFVFPASRPEAAAALRIFTPVREMKFAGHPTVGTAFVLFDEGKLPEHTTSFILEEKIGPVPVKIETGASPSFWLTTPPIHQGPARSREVCARVLGLRPDDLLSPDPEILSAGNPTIFVPVKSPAEVDRAWLEASGLREMRADYADTICAFVFAPTTDGAYSRMFAPDHGVAEDPATGSSTGPLAAYMLRHNLLQGQSRSAFVSEQGTKMRRRSLLHVRIGSEDQLIEVGGYVTPLVRAAMQL